MPRVLSRVSTEDAGWPGEFVPLPAQVATSRWRGARGTALVPNASSYASRTSTAVNDGDACTSVGDSAKKALSEGGEQVDQALSQAADSCKSAVTQLPAGEAQAALTDLCDAISGS